MTVIAENAPLSLSLSLQGVEDRRPGSSSESCATTSRGNRRSSWNALTTSPPPSTRITGKAWITMEHAPELQRSIKTLTPPGTPQSQRVYDISGLAPTLFARATGGHDGMTVDDTRLDRVQEERVRRLTELECERLQGFPDAHTEGVSGTQRYRQMGNAAPPPMIEAVAFRLLECWE